MQYTHTKVLDKANLRIWAVRAAKLVCFALSVYWVGHTMGKKNILTSSFADYAVSALAHPLVWAVVILLFFNWGIEALKWKLIAQKLHPLSYSDALSGVFTGVSLGLITPHGIGDYAGRVLQLQTTSRLEAIGAVFISRIAQLMITVWAGSAVIFYMIHTQKLSNVYLINFVLLQLVAVTNIFLLLLFLFYKKIAGFLKNRYTKPYLKILKLISPKEMTVVMLLSALRYGVFAMQYVLLLHYVEIPCSLPLLFGGVAFVFLVKSVVPTLFDIGIREAAAIYFFTLYSTGNPESIIFASLLLWLINIAFPALMGAWLIFKIRLDAAA